MFDVRCSIIEKIEVEVAPDFGFDVEGIPASHHAL
jgi:hypothetical protein